MNGAPMLSDTAKSAPHSPGVYIFRNSSGTPLYIGKAKDLRSRTASYFGSDILDRTQQMVSQASSLEFIVTDNEAEALVLESRLIKEHYPKYNIDLKDNEKFTYILITDEKYPRMLLVRRSRGGYVEVNCHLHTENGANFVESGSLVLSNSVLNASCLRKRSKAMLSRLSHSSLDRTNVFKLSYIEDSTLVRCTVIESPVVKCEFTDCRITNSPMSLKSYGGKVFVNGEEKVQDAAHSKEFKSMAQLVELTKSAWLWKQNTIDDGEMKGGRVPFARSLI